jgi:hypothetical protein
VAKVGCPEVAVGIYIDKQVERSYSYFLRVGKMATHPIGTQPNWVQADITHSKTQKPPLDGKT